MILLLVIILYTIHYTILLKKYDTTILYYIIVVLYHSMRQYTILRLSWYAKVVSAAKRARASESQKPASPAAIHGIQSVTAAEADIANGQIGFRSNRLPVSMTQVTKTMIVTATRATPTMGIHLAPRLTSTASTHAAGPVAKVMLVPVENTSY